MNIVVIKNIECVFSICVTTLNFAKFLLKIFFPVTISLDTEQTKKFRQSFIELKPSTLRTSDEISSFS